MNNRPPFILFIVVFVLVLEFLRARGFWKLFTTPNISSKTPAPRVMKPRSEKDCPDCQKALASGLPPPSACTHMPLPWIEKKSKRGRKKRICTQHQFCSNPDCAYYLIADENIHALVGYGTHGKYEDIQDLLCQACHKKFTVRRHTILYCLKTHSKTICLALNLLAHGVDISTLEEVLLIRESTIRSWLTRSGVQGRKLHERFFVNLELAHVQLDELWAKVKQAQQEVWVWVACEAKTKIVPVIQVGARTQDMAYSVVHELKSRMKADCVPVFSSDGLKHYFYALTAHFGEWICPDGETKSVWMILPTFFYAQVIKHKKRYALIEVEQRPIWGLPEVYRALLKAAGLSGNINTSFVERINLTLRHSISKLARRTWGIAQFSSDLTEHIYWWLAYYHFSRFHESLRIRLAEPIVRNGKQRPREYRKVTPAMAAGLARQRWSVMELVSYPLP